MRALGTTTGSTAVESMRRALLAVVMGSVLVAVGAGAQRQADKPALVSAIQRDDGTWLQLPARGAGFSLFADEDLAGASLKPKGSYRYAAYNAGGLCPFGNGSGDLYNSPCGNGAFFHYQVLWGVPPSAYKKILAVWPGVAGMQAPIGYSTPWRISVILPRVLRIGPADGQFGAYLSGVTATTTPGCRDVSGAQGAGLQKNFVLTAASDCPETWGSVGFNGMRTIPDSVWLGRFRENPSTFRWNDWNIPATAIANEPFIGDLTTYGGFSDYNRETLARFGSVTPRGNPLQPATERGFPLGIEVRYDAFKFDRPSLREGVFVRWLVMNNSQKVWGAGIDYDSLYMGVDPGYIRLGGQMSLYNAPALGLQVLASGGLSGRCTSTFPRRLGSAGGGCPAPVARAQHMTLLLKSPIGDLRNKLFSNPGSPYYLPGSLKADDTITFNHWRNGAFGFQDVNAWRRNDRALFGYMSGNEQLWLDGRQATEFSAAQMWVYFRYEFTDGTGAASNLRYNRSVPGNIPGYGKWDYNDDGIQDTLMLPDCGVNGCAAMWSDTIPGGFNANAPGEVFNFLGVGPFSLKAGDTTEFLWYLGTAADTFAVRNVVRNVTNAYLKGFNTLLPPPGPVLTANDVQVTSTFARDTIRTSAVRIGVRMPPIGKDLYLTDVVTRLQSADPAAVELRRLNPGLVARVQARANQNLARVLVFKSCDDGKSWTDASGTCESALTARTESRTGATTGYGWQSFREITVDTVTGALASHAVTDVVQGGREYLYSFVTQSRALADITVVYQQQMDAGGTVTSSKVGTLADALAVDVDTVGSKLEVSGLTTVRVYAPVSVAAGTSLARVDTATRQGVATHPLDIAVRTPHVGGTYRMRFGNQFILTRSIDTLTGTHSTIVVRQSSYARAATAPTAPVIPNFVAAADTFASGHDVTYTAYSLNSPPIRTTPRFTTGSVQVFIDTIAASGYVVAGGAGTSDALFLAVSGTSGSSNTFTTIGQVTDGFEGTRYYPGFTATPYNFSAYQAKPALVSVTLGTRGDTLPGRHIDSAGVQYRTAYSGLRSSPGGRYRIEWLDDAFGPGAPFAFGTPASLHDATSASLASRVVAFTTEVDLGSQAQILAGTNNVRGRAPIRARLPFRVIGSNGRPARVVMISRHQTGASLTTGLTPAQDSIYRNSRLLGTRGDTARVSIPADMWVPGDTLYIVEDIVVDSTVTIGGTPVFVVRDTMVNGRVQTLPIRVVRPTYGAMLMLGCASNVTPSRETCNPIRPGPNGYSDYQPYASGFTSIITFNRPFDQNSEVLLTASPTAAQALPVTKTDMDRIHVVPNPFVVQSSYDFLNSNGSTTSRILFVNVPSEGMLRIYTVSGQMVQQLSWTAADLVARGDNSPHGDLPWNLRTREGTDLASGLYLYVLTARGTGANGQVVRGKFVVIR